jgi:hypothetical protein
MCVVLFNFFKISVFANAGVDVGILVLIGLAVLSPLLHGIVHAPLQLIHLSPEYPFDNQGKSVEKQNDDK